MISSPSRSAVLTRAKNSVLRASSVNRSNMWAVQVVALQVRQGADYVAVSLLQMPAVFDKPDAGACDRGQTSGAGRSRLTSCRARPYAHAVRGHPSLTNSERAALREFLERVPTVPGVVLKEAHLFGSRARGEGHEHSDLDVALIVADGGRLARHRIYDLAFDVGLAYGVELAPLVLEESRLAQLRSRERHLARALDVEGVPL